MSEAKFTKGEWYSCISYDEIGNRSFAAESMLECGESVLICETAESMTSDTDESLPSMAECNANYSLIETAPEMYREIEKDISWLERMISTHGDNHPMTPMFEDMKKDKISLLAKARGEL